MDSPPEIRIPISDRAAYLGRVHVGVTIPLLALCLVPFSARLYTRVRPVMRCGWDDVFMVLGFGLTISDWVMLQFEMHMTPQTISISTATNAMKLAYLAIPVWNAAMTCIKISVALTLLRIPVNRLWTVFLHTVVSLQIAFFTGNTVYVFLACRPLAALWDFSITDAICLGPASSRIASNVGSGINITTDLTLSLAPIVVLWNMRRPLRERILVCALMATGLFASAASIVKAVIVREWGDPNVDAWALSTSIATWTILEQLLAVLAACSPSLKGPLQRLLGQFGILLTRYNSRISFISRNDSRTTGQEMGQDARPVHLCPSDGSYSKADDNSVELRLEGTSSLPRDEEDGVVAKARAA